ncbi:hypothetical protein [Microbacterium immunditiarum]|uniref:Protein-L-isoaspartate carboxylmethyltransferase n=1 Tax=Microbacterium immunditiarum TaxID=337480 RepID=A0A7Y9GP94_9MICO|nr:hypothetical protein [Microbacterium immunditiarum]NYE19025.1 hypothetical protein [Microbacterium immunditiarum]
MPFRSRETLEGWLAEFNSLDYPVAGAFKVMQQDGEDGANTGLVGVELAHASTVMYVHPEAPYSERWVVTMEARAETISLDAAEVMRLAAELSVLSALCAFLQAKSSSFVGVDAP